MTIRTVLSLVLFSSAAPAWAEIGPVSTARIGISISISPAFGLKNNIVGDSAVAIGTNGFCIATNSTPMALPVRVFRQTANESGVEGQGIKKAMPLDWCDGAGLNLAPIDRGDGEEAAGLLIVRPD